MVAVDALDAGVLCKRLRLLAQVRIGDGEHARVGDAGEDAFCVDLADAARADDADVDHDGFLPPSLRLHFAASSAPRSAAASCASTYSREGRHSVSSANAPV